jgi:Uncharacterized conserved protein
VFISPTRDKTFGAARQPSNTTLVGYAAIIAGLGVHTPMPRVISVVADGRVKPDRGRNHAARDGFAIYENRFAVGDDLGEHLAFAIKHERTDLLALKRIFTHGDRGGADVAEAVRDYVRAAPTGRLRRQVWFFYEWLTGRRLDLPDLDVGNYVDALDPEVWQTASPVNSPRHRVRDNLPGTPDFCPLVDRTVGWGEPLRDVVERRVGALVGDSGVDHVRRLARRLLLKDSKSTYFIENETPGPSQAQRWAEIVQTAGREPMDVDLLVRHQRVLIPEHRFIDSGLRRDNVFIGDHVDGMAAPKWIGARHEDLENLTDGIFAAGRRMAESGMDPIAQATSMGFGWLYVHPFEDGNGRIHRYMMQHVLVERGIAPEGMTMPISKAIWQDIDGYHRVLRDLDLERMPFIEWRQGGNGNVEVTADTSDLYRFFDATEHARYMMGRLEHVIGHDIPNEITEIRRRDEIVSRISAIVEMPDRQIDLINAMIIQNGGTLSKNKRRKDFDSLTDDEVAEIEEAVRDVYEIEAPEADVAPVP